MFVGYNSQEPVVHAPSTRFFLALPLFTLMYLGQAGPDVFAQDMGGRECFSLEGSTEHFFGEIEQSTTVEHTFVFRNNCADTVEIGSARASCGCTATVVSERVVPPGGEAKVLVKFTPPRGSRDRVSKTVSLYLKGEGEAHTVLRISAALRSDIALEPSYIQLSGATAGIPISANSRITNTTDREIVVTTTGVSLTSYRDLDGSGKMETVPLDGGRVSPTALTLAPGESEVLTITFTPEFVGQINGSVGLRIGPNASVIYLFGVVGEAAPKK
jgi:hypothetical protein